jgi:26S proteasome regulatory subunit N9
MTSVDPLVHGSFYRVSADYFKATMDYSQYYKNALLYLACVQLEDLSGPEREERAHDLALCALLADSIYNFGELLMHPVLDSLKATPREFLRDLLFAFNAGDIGKFDVLSSSFQKQPLLAQNINFLRQKICLMALIELVFKRPGDGRRIPFATIAQETRLPQDEVEHLLMKALSLDLLRGKVDQVDQVIHVEWVQPRVLDKNQIAGLRMQISKWQSRVTSLATSVAKQLA